MAQRTPFEEWIFKNFLGEDPQTPPPHIQGDYMSFSGDISEESTLWCTYTPVLPLIFYSISFYVLLGAIKICKTPRSRYAKVSLLPILITRSLCHVYFTNSKSRTGESIPDALSGVISCYTMSCQSVNCENGRVHHLTTGKKINGLY